MPPSDRPPRRRGRRHPHWIAFFAALLAGIAGIVAVGDARLIGDAVEQRNLAAFYDQPAGALDGAPGSLVRSKELTGVPFEARAWRVMYRTTDVHGASRPVSSPS